MSFLVRDFIHAAPANNNRKVRKLRYGAATAFVDAESGELIAGYSYNACLYTVAASEEFPNGRLYVNKTSYGPTSQRHARWLETMVADRYLSRWLPTGETYAWGSDITEEHPPLNGWEADCYTVSRYASARDLVLDCEHNADRLRRDAESELEDVTEANSAA